MNFLMSAKIAAVKTKLKGEMALLDREITTRQKAMGVELYNLLVLTDTSVAGVKTPSIFHANQARIQEPFDACRSDIRLMMDEKNAKEQEIVHIEANRERSRPSRDNQESLAKAGNWISSTGTEAKLTVQLKKLERDMKLRKEQFGLDVFGLLETGEKLGEVHSSPEKNSGVLGRLKDGGKSAVAGVKTGIAGKLSKLSKSEQEIQACIDNAKKDVAFIENRKEFKLREIDRLYKD